MLPIVIGGCPGSGKTSVAKHLAGSIENCVLIETDHFFDFLQDPIDPSTLASQGQNETVIAAYAEAANVYRKSGYTVILEGVIGPWVFPILLPALGSFRYVLLQTSLTCAVQRVAARASKSVSLGKVERMHPLFEEAASAYNAHVVDAENKPISSVTENVLVKLQNSHCEIPVS